jgi:hypothetical protein
MPKKSAGSGQGKGAGESENADESVTDRVLGAVEAVAVALNRATALEGDSA